MDSTLCKIAPDVYRISTFHPEFGIQFNQFLVKDDEPLRESIIQNLAGPLANDMPYMPYTDATLRRIAELRPHTLAVMHGSTFQDDGAAAIQSLAQFIGETLGEHK